MEMLEEEEMERYRRQLILSEIGIAGQERLKKAKVLIVGAGGLGSPCALYLAAAGIGTLGIVDSDQVEISNLQRQILYTAADVGRGKAEAAGTALRALNPHCLTEVIDGRLTADNVDDVVGNYDVVVACVDNFPTRYLLNGACLRSGRPLVEAGVLGFAAILMTIVPGEGPCYHCVFPEKRLAEAKRELGVVGAAAGIAGSFQAMEVLKLLLGFGQPLTGRLLTIDALDGTVRSIRIRPDPDCPVCGELRLK
jgi:molybdopterin/thiamine biosynthesis adenylyltransferase